MDFSEAVFLKNTTSGSTIGRLGDFLDQDSSGFSLVTTLGRGLAQVSCGSTVFPDQDQVRVLQQRACDASKTLLARPIPDPCVGSSGPGNQYLTAPPTSDPAFSMLSAVFLGQVLVESQLPNRWSVVYPVPKDSVSVRTAPCLAVFPGARLGNTTLVDASGAAIRLNVTMAYRAPVCTVDGIKDLLSFYDSIARTDIGTSEQLNQLFAKISTYSTKQALQGCLLFLQKYIVSAETTVTRTTGPRCSYRSDQPEFALSPCCNRSLEATQCCRGGVISQKRNTITSFQDLAINTDCKGNYTEAYIVLQAYQSVVNDAAQYSPLLADPQSSFKTNTAFISACRTSIYSTVCSTDSECTYSLKCGSQGYCAVDQTQEHIPLLRCLLATMPAGVKTSLRRSLAMTTIYAAAEDEVQAVVAKFVAQGTVKDCSGPTRYGICNPVKCSAVVQTQHLDVIQRALTLMPSLKQTKLHVSLIKNAV